MLFAVVAMSYFFVLSLVAALMEFCLFRLNDFRCSQRRKFPVLCGMIDHAWAILHIDFVFDYEEDPEDCTVSVPA